LGTPRRTRGASAPAFGLDTLQRTSGAWVLLLGWGQVVLGSWLLTLGE